MGSFFTNMQVYSKQKDKNQSLSQIKEAIHIILDKDYEIASENEETDRIILVKHSDPWITIYDQETEDQDIDLLYDVSSKISSILDTVVVSVLVHDSDVLNLCLFEQGELKNNYWSNPEFLSDELPISKLKKLKGNPNLWKSRLLKGYSTQT